MHNSTFNFPTRKYKFNFWVIFYILDYTTRPRSARSLGLVPSFHLWWSTLDIFYRLGGDSTCLRFRLLCPLTCSILSFFVLSILLHLVFSPPGIVLHFSLQRVVLSFALIQMCLRPKFCCIYQEEFCK